MKKLTKRVQYGRYLKMESVILVDNKFDKELTEQFKQLDCRNIEELNEEELKILRDFYFFCDDEDEKESMLETIDEVLNKNSSDDFY